MAAPDSAAARTLVVPEEALQAVQLRQLPGDAGVVLVEVRHVLAAGRVPRAVERVEPLVDAVGDARSCEVGRRLPRPAGLHGDVARVEPRDLQAAHPEAERGARGDMVRPVAVGAQAAVEADRRQLARREGEVLPLVRRPGLHEAVRADRCADLEPGREALQAAAETRRQVGVVARGRGPAQLHRGGARAVRERVTQAEVEVAETGAGGGRAGPAHGVAQRRQRHLDAEALLPSQLGVRGEAALLEQSAQRHAVAVLVVVGAGGEEAAAQLGVVLARGEGPRARDGDGRGARHERGGRERGNGETAQAHPAS